MNRSPISDSGALLDALQANHYRGSKKGQFFATVMPDGAGGLD